MNWKQYFKPTKRKILFSLIPFVFPAVQLFVELHIETNIIPTTISRLTYIPEMIIMGIEIFISTPFAPLLRLFGFWSDNSGLAFDGPLLPGSFVVAILYFFILYTYFSLEASYKARNQGNKIR